MREANVLELAQDQRQWQFFAEFVRWETTAGGPDPHMALTGAMCAGESWLVRAWRGGCYLGVYNVPTAEMIWRNWSHERVLAEPEGLEPWLSDNWAGLAFRRERRAARSSIKLARYLTTYAAWIEHAQDQPWWSSDYDAAWAAAEGVYSVGRYIKLKLLEYLYRYCDAPFRLTDMRAQGGWSPRTALCLLYPERADALLGNDAPENVVIAERTANETQERLIAEFGLSLDHYNLQVLLCDYKQSYAGRRQFPGRSQDSEIAYFNKITSHWQEPTDIFKTRARIFPHQVLGEIQGWDRVREELGDVLRDHGYTWTDMSYDFCATKELARPVLR